MNTTPDDREALDPLLVRTALHDESAFAELYRRTSARLFGICLRMLPDRAEAEDALQEVFVAVWRRAQSYDPALGSAMTWLVTITRNRTIDRLRQSGDRSRRDLIDLDRLPDEGRGPSAATEASEEYRLLQLCLDQLEVNHRRSVREAFFSGATYKEMAERCQVPLGTMKSWIRRALIQLRACLES
ncbi:MAG: sigma-70 family RNA polymerase sigma factor [Steroidobacteraceae bacterium]